MKKRVNILTACNFVTYYKKLGQMTTMHKLVVAFPVKVTGWSVDIQAIRVLSLEVTEGPPLSRTPCINIRILKLETRS